MIDPGSIRALSALIRSGSTVRQALHAWPNELPADRQDEAALVASRLVLGCSVFEALSALPPESGRMLTPLLSLHLSAGGDVASALDRLADDLEREASFQQDAKAASSGARLSGRMVAALPLAFVPFSPATRDLGDLPALMLVLVGAAMAAVGLRWIGRLVPVAPAADPSVELCSVLATLLRGGLSVAQALSTVVSHPPAGLEEPLDRAADRVRLGLSWSLSLADERGLDRVARVIARAQGAGLPVAASLEQLADTLRMERALAFKARMRRAPVLMVVPLTCCILPSYGLLAIGPFLRSVSLS